jgi:hypothetical protein
MSDTAIIVTGLLAAGGSVFLALGGSAPLYVAAPLGVWSVLLATGVMG